MRCLQYFVQWESWGNQYNEWVSASDVTIQAIDDFNPPASQASAKSLLEDLQSATHAIEEFQTFHPECTVNVLDSKDLPYFARREFRSTLQRQRSVLFKLRSTRPTQKRNNKGNDKSTRPQKRLALSVTADVVRLGTDNSNVDTDIGGDVVESNSISAFLPDLQDTTTTATSTLGVDTESSSDMQCATVDILSVISSPDGSRSTMNSCD